MKNIASVARGLGIAGCDLDCYGKYKAKLSLSLLEKKDFCRHPKYVFVSAMTPTPWGEGKTTTTLGLSMAFHRLGRRSAAVVRQASLGPLFGSKGGGCGGGAARIVPEDEAGLHLTGDAHAVAAANNFLVAFAENSIFHGNPFAIDPKTLVQKRCLDSSDRSLRRIAYALKSGTGSHEIATGFEVTAASEVMSILALSRDAADMRQRLSQMTVGRGPGGRRVTARDIKADGMMAALLRDAFRPNLMQTCEGAPCLIHAGPFANVSVGASSVIADRIALKRCDIVVTESGFGADCGAEKFFDLKCRASGLVPDACVLVCSARALKFQSRCLADTPCEKWPEALAREDTEAVREGFVNLKKQIENIKIFGVPVVVSVSVFPTDTEKELACIHDLAAESGASDCVVCEAHRLGSKGSLALARSVLKAAGKKTAFRFLYPDEMPLAEKITTLAARIYGAKSVDFSPEARGALSLFEKDGFGRLPVCISKTQFSLSHDEHLKGAPTGFVFPVKEVRLLSGARFVLALASATQAMPGLPKHPRGEQVDADDEGHIFGLT